MSPFSCEHERETVTGLGCEARLVATSIEDLYANAIQGQDLQGKRKPKLVELFV